MITINKNDKKIFNNFVILIFSVLSTISFTIIMNNLSNLSISKSLYSGGTLLLLILVFMFFAFYKKTLFYNEKHDFLLHFLAVLFSLFMIFGYSYKLVGNWSLIFGSKRAILFSIIKFVGYDVFFYAVLIWLYKYLKNLKIKNNNNSKILKFIFDKNPFWVCFLIIIFSWLIYIIAYYPGILAPDPANQIKQFFGIPGYWNRFAKPISDKVMITNYHPAFHTIILGIFLSIGKFFHSDNLGIFLYCIIQVIIMALLFSYTMSYMKKLNTPYAIRIFALLFYCLAPIFPYYGLSMHKDVPFAIFVTLYIIKLYELLKKSNQRKYSKFEIIKLIFLMFMICMFRNNGIYLVIFSFPLLLLVDKENRRKILLTFLIPVVLYISYVKVLLPIMKIPEGSSQVILTIPFQQTARYVKEYGYDVKDNERKVIDKILKYDTLAERYDPDCSDAVFSQYNPEITKKDLLAYFKVWGSQFIRHPNVYIEATLANTYGYFYPDAKNWYVYTGYDTRLNETKKFDYHFNSFSNLRENLAKYSDFFQSTPLLGSLVSIGIYNWLILTMMVFLIKSKRYKYLIFLMPALISILVCIASPANTYFRYILGYVFAFPIMISIFLNILREKKKGEDNYE